MYQQISDKHYKKIDALGGYSYYLLSCDLKETKSGLWPKEWIKKSKDDKPEYSDEENMFLGDLIRNIMNKSEEKSKTICTANCSALKSHIQLTMDHVKE